MTASPTNISHILYDQIFVQAGNDVIENLKASYPLD